MHRFKHGALFADVGARHQTQAADQSGTQVRNDVTVEVFAEQDVELFGAHDQLHRSVIDDHALPLDLGIKLADFFKASQKQSVRKLHDIRFVNCGDLFSLFAARVSEGKTGNASRSLFSDDLQALDHAGNDFVFES